MASILIIDPDPVARQLLQEFVTELGHEISGPQDMASGPGPDLVLLDPVDPAALSEALSLRREHELLPIVCVSSARSSDEIEALEPSAFLMKPFRGRLVDWAIAEALAAAPVLVAA